MPIEEAIAMAGNPSAATGETAGFGASILPMLVVFFIFYFLLIRPQKKKESKHQEFLSKLEKGQDVLTHSGIFGKIVGLTDKVVTLEIAPETRVKMLRSAVASGANFDEQKK